LHNKDTASFERYLSQLKTYYQDVKYVAILSSFFIYQN